VAETERFRIARCGTAEHQGSNEGRGLDQIELTPERSARR
jgi:hypothetical protein